MWFSLVCGLSRLRRTTEDVISYRKVEVLSYLQLVFTLSINYHLYLSHHNAQIVYILEHTFTNFSWKWKCKYIGLKTHIDFLFTGK